MEERITLEYLKQNGFDCDNIDRPYKHLDKANTLILARLSEYHFIPILSKDWHSQMYLRGTIERKSQLNNIVFALTDKNLSEIE